MRVQASQISEFAGYTARINGLCQACDDVDSCLDRAAAVENGQDESMADTDAALKVRRKRRCHNELVVAAPLLECRGISQLSPPAYDARSSATVFSSMSDSAPGTCIRLNQPQSPQPPALCFKIGAGESLLLM